MKHYEKLLELGCFSKNDLEQITGSEAAAKWLCREYQKKGYIERVKRDIPADCPAHYWRYHRDKRNPCHNAGADGD